MVYFWLAVRNSVWLRAKFLRVATWCVCVIVLVLTVGHVGAQNLISNGCFETYSELPTGNGQINKAIGWEDVVRSCDLINEGYPGWHAVNSFAKSGTGYAGFASYGNSGRAAEAMGQRLKEPLEAGKTYRISFYVKKQAEGAFDDGCSGVAVYGFHKPWIKKELRGIHVKNQLGSIALWTSEKVVNNDWVRMSGCFKPRVNISYLAFTTEYISDCKQYILIDDISLYVHEGGLQEAEKGDTTQCACMLYIPTAFSPNNDGVNDLFVVRSACKVDSFELLIFNRMGQCVFESSHASKSWNGWCGQFEAPIGLYLYLLRYKRQDGKAIEEQGRLRLIR